MKRGHILMFLVIVFLSLYFVSADTFTIASSKGEIIVGGISGDHVGSFTGIPVSAPASTSSYSGGGSGIVIPRSPIPNLTVSPTSFNLPVSAGIQSSGGIVLINTGTTSINITITISSLKGVIVFNQTNLTLTPNESKILDFLVNPPGKAGVYAGKIFFSSANYRTQVPIALNVGEGQSLFDIFVKIPESYRQITQGQNLVSNITLVQKGTQKETDVAVEYSIRDFNGNVYSSKVGTMAIFNRKSYQEEFNTSHLPPGDYLVGVKAIYSGGIATASSTFTVKPIEQIPQRASESIFSKIASFAKHAFNRIGIFAKKAFDKIGKVFRSISFKIVFIVIFGFVYTYRFVFYSKSYN